MENGNPGDWDRGISKNVDGAFINKADEGNVNFDLTRTGGTRLPYYLGYGGAEETGPSYFSPNRLMPSAVMFGSLPSRPLQLRAWETLLFRPPTTPGKTDHPGAAEPADHYLLDLFHMPIVEPWAISEPFSTAGKININTDLAPFSYLKVANGTEKSGYIERKTGLHALLKPIKLLCVPNTASNSAHTEDPTTIGDIFRYDIDRKLTIEEIQRRLDKGLFRSASEICEVPLYPKGLVTGAVPDWSNFWNNTYGATGDNQRERPYALIYPRVTTKSNVFTVHMLCQSVRKSLNTPPDQFVENKDPVVSQWRGSMVIERYLDPNDSALAGYDPIKNGSLDAYYRFRVLSTRQFISR